LIGALVCVRVYSLRRIDVLFGLRFSQYRDDDAQDKQGEERDDESEEPDAYCFVECLAEYAV